MCDSDSGIDIKSYPDDIVSLIERVIKNGYDLYGNKILNKYNKTNYSSLDLIEIATLGYLSGYRYMSISKKNVNDEQKNIFFSYSPPMSSNKEGDIAVSDLPSFTLTPKINQYTNEEENAQGKEISCGFPCLKNGKPQIFNKDKQFMCGSIVYPTIKTPPRFAVYEIYEKN